jgi:hydroxymethylpyrimidine/phosphomethylpyrimidine kinase
VLAIAASDPTGGAGVQADLLTLASLGCHPVSAITALTVQDTHGVQRLVAIEPRWVAEQLRCLLEDVEVAAIKLGVLGSAGNVAAVAAVLDARREVPVVLDPVLASGRGDSLAGEETLAALREQLLPRATVVTPNSLEARRLAAAVPGAALADCAREIAALGCRYVLVTGTHEPGTQVLNALYDAHGPVREDRWKRLRGRYHGSGCTLASAIAALLAAGYTVPQAVRRAQEFTWNALAAAFRAGGGQWLPDRFFAARAASAPRRRVTR